MRPLPSAWSPYIPAQALALTASPSSFRCVCEPGWSGPRCSQSLTRDACESQPCQAGGTCTSDGIGFHCTCPPGVQGECPHLPSQCHIPFFSFPFCSILSSSSAFALLPLFSPLLKTLGGGYQGRDPGGRREQGLPQGLPHSALPSQAISVNCCPSAPRAPVSMGATVSLPQAGRLSAPVPWAGKVHQLLLLPPPLFLYLLCTLPHTR